jgi:hypothetical protein
VNRLRIVVEVLLIALLLGYIVWQNLRVPPPSVPVPYDLRKDRLYQLQQKIVVLKGKVLSDFRV